MAQERVMARQPTEHSFRIAWTADFFGPDGSPRYPDLGQAVFDGQAHVKCRAFAKHLQEITAEQVGDAQGVIVLTPAVTAASVWRSADLLAIGRFGVGFDAVDVRACTEADICVLIARGAVDRSVAEATLAWMLALTHHVRAKDALARTGRWEERSRYMGSELRERTLGVIGLGGIGQALVRLVAGLGMRPPLAFDPYADPSLAQAVGATLVELDELLRKADFVSIHCPLTETTRGLIGARELALMKPTAWLLNTARGGIVDEDALHAALARHRIAGAAVDVFAAEPVTSPPRLAELDNVLLAPHCIAWTGEMFRDIGRTVCRAMLDLSLGRRPGGIVNHEVFDRPSFQVKWRRLQCEPASAATEQA
jgi:phosphoglycerate dehydrogenase-like enzyme